MKVCGSCKVEKDLDLFGNNRSKKDGKQDRCNECRKEYRQKHKETIAEAKAKHYKENKERISKYQSEYYLKNRERIIQRVSKRYEENKEQIAEYKKEWYAEYYSKNKESILESQADNPHWGWESYYRFRAKKYNFDPVVESFTREELVSKWGDRCWHCSGNFEELDHYPVPVMYQGEHSLYNCRPSCRDCNYVSWREYENCQETTNEMEEK